ncbi:Ivy family c-type lysozyme inhibitor [Burkholderia metallica]|uniref:Ivy family c-type lysozyme inhibitor n=1 Tax=Burkholderia metallica TaxID=488729 RepID=UPI0020C6A2E9|nr:Ivy family c-type lysozyme inhibitor [Burkholderia metallica]
MSAIAEDRAASTAFKAMTKGHQLPAWVARGGTESPAIAITFGGHDAYAMTACKPHDCGAEQIAVIYDPQQNIMYGVLSVSSAKARTERLTWFNIDGADESADGRTILYAALTGSLENHPGSFNFK